jgi:phosphate binding protein
MSVVMIVVLSFTAFGSVSAQDQTIVEIAAGNPDFSTLVAAVTAAGLVETLSGEGPFTVFAPTNAAFEEALMAMGMSAEEVLANPEALTAILTYHVVPGKLMAADVIASESLTTVNGQDLTVSVEGESVLINTALIEAADIEASNGVIHVINQVLIPAVQLPEVDPLAVSGDIITAGSSTVFPLTSALAEQFEADGYTGTITVDSIGTGAGFERFCVNAETDISNASRPVREGEVADCATNGRTILEFRVGTDALAIAVSAENTFVDNLTIAQLGLIYSGTAVTWADVNPEWPADPISLFSPGTDSGTFDYFVEAVMEPHAEAIGTAEDMVGDVAEESILNASGIQFSENDNVLVEGVAGSPNAIGYFGFAYFEEAGDIIRLVTVEGVEPNEVTAETGDYPLARPLFIYSAAEILAEKPQVAAFINYYLTNVNDLILGVGYFPASAAALNEAKNTWLANAGE